MSLFSPVGVGFDLATDRTLLMIKGLVASATLFIILDFSHKTFLQPAIHTSIL
jgi:hypothetical protein